MSPFTSPFFSNTTGYTGEINLLDDLVREQIKLFGVDLLYMPRKMLNLDKLLHESSKSAFELALSMPMYIKTFDGYDQGMELLSKFGVRSSDELTLTVSRSEFNTFYSPFLKSYYESIGGVLNPLEGETASRPKEGDLIYFPFDDGVFEIKYVMFDQPFFQFGKGYIFEMRCEKFEYSGETFSTGYDAVDDTNDGNTYYTLEFLLDEGGSGTFGDREIVTITPMADQLIGSDPGSLISAENDDIVTTENQNSIMPDQQGPDFPVITTERGVVITSDGSNDEYKLYTTAGTVSDVTSVTASVISWDKPNRKLKLSFFSNEDPTQKDPITGDIDVDKLENSLIVGSTTNARWTISSGVTLNNDEFNDDDIIQEEFDEIKIIDPADTNPFGFV